MPHYFTNDPHLAHDERPVSFEISGISLRCLTDSGVFAKSGLDAGTRLLITSLPPMRGTIVDLGCGWGALGITIALLNPDARIVMLDINERAVSLAAHNARLNNASNTAVMVSDGLAGYDGPADYILTNPPIRAGKAVVHGFFEQAAQRLVSGGALYAVVRKAQGADSAKKKIAELFGNAETVARGGGYHVIRGDRG